MRTTAAVNKTTPSREVKALLRAYHPEVEAIGLGARALILEIFPDLNTEVVDNKVRVIGYGYGPKYVDTVCVVMPTDHGITLGIGHGSELPDPANLMEGTGKVHRHVKLKTKADLDNPALKALLKAALARRKKLGFAIS
jgi:hypothetical protein